MSVALVLSGGGARGAYEVGVLSYLFDELRSRNGASPIRIISGTSVGAINGAYLASVLEDPVTGLAHLETLWRDLTLNSVLGFGVGQARRLHRLMLGGRRGSGLFDPTFFAKLVRRGIKWRRIGQNLRTGRLQALTVTATQVSTGRPICFVEPAPNCPLPTIAPKMVSVQTAHIRSHHVLASASIPVIFPPVFIHTDLFCDGGLRLNTPLAPALHLGADRVIVVGVSTAMSARKPEIARGRYPGLPFLLGKVFDALLVDRVNLDLTELERVNGFLRDGITAYGDEFPERLNGAARARGAPARRLVSCLTMRPTHDVGALAKDFLGSARTTLKRTLGRSLLRALEVGEGTNTADLASYLLFDGSFARELIELGRRDAHRRRDELAAFLYED